MLDRLRARLRTLPGVSRTRMATEHVVTPSVKADIARLTGEVNALRATLDDLEAAMPRLLDLISTVSGSVALLRQEIDGTPADAVPDPTRRSE